jgi:hypothetical protein
MRGGEGDVFYFLFLFLFLWNTERETSEKECHKLRELMD